MSAQATASGAWEDPDFWRLFQQLEADHSTVLGEHEIARRELERVVRSDDREFMHAWADYKAAVLRLDDAASALADLRPGAESGAVMVAAEIDVGTHALEREPEGLSAQWASEPL